MEAGTLVVPQIFTQLTRGQSLGQENDTMEYLKLRYYRWRCRQIVIESLDCWAEYQRFVGQKLFLAECLVAQERYLLCHRQLDILLPKYRALHLKLKGTDL